MNAHAERKSQLEVSHRSVVFDVSSHIDTMLH